VIVTLPTAKAGRVSNLKIKHKQVELGLQFLLKKGNYSKYSGRCPVPPFETQKRENFKKRMSALNRGTGAEVEEIQMVQEDKQSLFMEKL
jgi:hypothetical protein